jgi:GNAT superfamily N-acetyltransferase
MWAVREAQLAEDGVAPDSIAAVQQPHPGVFVDTQYDVDLENIDQVYLRGAGGFWLAWYAGHPVGYVGAQDVGGAIELRRMYVKASCRRLGVGTRLVEALISHTRAEAVGVIELWTASDGPGRKFYQALGFREARGPGVEYQDLAVLTRYAPGADEVRLRLDL